MSEEPAHGDPQTDAEETVKLQFNENEQVEVKTSSKVLEIDRKYAAFKVEPKKDEVGDPNFPPHLHAAFELFCMTRNFALAKRLKQCTDAFLEILSKGPDGTSSQSMGRAAVCWGCGYVGLPKNADAGKNSVAECSGCTSDEQTNYVQVKQPDGSVVPWMENKVGMEAEKAEAAAGAAEQEKAADAAEAAADAAADAAEQDGKKPDSDDKKTMGKVKPNEPCRCSSGKKFKKCCGAN